jgi:hypothetical protein
MRDEFKEKSRPLFKEVCPKVLMGKQADKAAIMKAFVWLKDAVGKNDVAVVFCLGAWRS